jgi:general L-amino acid transport system substrate-binding protein
MHPNDQASAIQAARPAQSRAGTAIRNLLAGAMTLGAAALATGVEAQTLDQIRQRGVLICGSHPGLPGFGLPDANGNWAGFDIDFCRALSAAIFDDPSKVRFIPMTVKDRFTALQARDIDVLSRNVTYTMTRDTQFGFNWPAITFYDGQGFLVRSSLKVASVKQLNGASICVAQGTTTELNLADYARTNGMKFETITFSTTEEGLKAMEAGRCDAFTTDRSGLAGERLKLTRSEEFIILPETISKEPLGPVVRHGDEQWNDIVRWTHQAMLNAEELGVTKSNIDEMLKSTNPEIKRLLGTEGKFGEMLGLGNDWAYRIIKHVGNYAENYDRHVGAGSRLKISRGLNELYTRGGVQYPQPIR